MKRLWIIPAIIMGLFLLAWVFRWDYGPTKASDTQIIQWRIDRWTGQGWIKVYSIEQNSRGIFEVPALPFTSPEPKEENAWLIRKDYEMRWQQLLSIDIVLLLISSLIAWRNNRRKSIVKNAKQE